MSSIPNPVVIVIITKQLFTYHSLLTCRNHRVLQQSSQHCTRFISLANVGNPDKKQRFLYAFNIAPMAGMATSELTAQPQAATDCPYTKSVAHYHQSKVSCLFLVSEEYPNVKLLSLEFMCTKNVIRKKYCT